MPQPPERSNQQSQQFAQIDVNVAAAENPLAALAESDRVFTRLLPQIDQFVSPNQKLNRRPFLHIALGKLVSNAVDSIHTRQLNQPDLSPHVTVAAEITEEGYFRISVTDNGTGVDPNIGQQLFTRRIDSPKRDQGYLGGQGDALFALAMLGKERMIFTEGTKGRVGFENIVEDNTVVGATFWAEVPALVA